MAGERRHCVHCDKEVEVVGEGLMSNDAVLVLSCGHVSKKDQQSIIDLMSVVRSMPSPLEAISGAWDKLPAAKISKIEPMMKGTIPVQVSGEAMPKTQGRLDISTLVLNKERNVFVGNPTIYVNSTHNESHFDMSTTTINNLNDVLLIVENSRNSPEKKSKIKEILSIIDREKSSKSMSEVFSSSLHHLKTWLPIATPYIILLMTLSK